MKKICYKCHKEKNIFDFYKDKSRADGYSYICKSCEKEKSKKYNTRSEIKEQRKIYWKKYNIENQERIRNYRNKTREERKRKQKEYYKKNRKARLENTKRWKNIHKEYSSRYQYKKRKEDINFRIAQTIRNRMNNALKNNRKSSKSFNLLGCNLETLKNHLQRTAITNGYSEFNINDYSGDKYHIDHIVPCAAFHLTCSYHQRLCFHWSNLQILSAKKNQEKGDKICL